jgi:hypothetical protein
VNEYAAALAELLEAAQDVVVQRGRYYRNGEEDPRISVVPRSALRSLDSALVHFRAVTPNEGVLALTTAEAVNTRLGGKP